MKAISTRVTKGIQVGSLLKCVDNTGAKELEVIAVKKWRGVRKKRGEAGVGDLIVCTVKKGTQKMKHEVVTAVVVRQRMPYRRSDGTHIKFADNAAVLINDKMEPRGKEIKDIVAREAVERFPAVGKLARTII